MNQDNQPLEQGRAYLHGKIQCCTEILKLASGPEAVELHQLGDTLGELTLPGLD